MYRTVYAGQVYSIEILIFVELIFVDFISIIQIHIFIHIKQIRPFCPPCHFKNDEEKPIEPPGNVSFAVYQIQRSKYVYSFQARDS